MFNAKHVKKIKNKTSYTEIVYIVILQAAIQVKVSPL